MTSKLRQCKKTTITIPSSQKNFYTRPCHRFPLPWLQMLLFSRAFVRDSAIFSCLFYDATIFSCLCYEATIFSYICYDATIFSCICQRCCYFLLCLLQIQASSPSICYRFQHLFLMFVTDSSIFSQSLHVFNCHVLLVRFEHKLCVM